MWFLGDHLGSTQVVANGETGALLERYLYKPWGELRAGSLATGPLFTGQVWENEVGLYDYQARFYDSALGRFISPDSVVPELGNPLRYTDPSGHSQATGGVGLTSDAQGGLHSLG